jgi:excisionase family DNA binding protein
MTTGNHSQQPHPASNGPLILTTPRELDRLIQSSVARALMGVLTPWQLPDSGHERYLTVSEAAAYLSLAKQTLYGFTSNRTIPFIKKAKRLLFLKSDLDRWLAGGRKHPQEMLTGATQTCAEVAINGA